MVEENLGSEKSPKEKIKFFRVGLGKPAHIISQHCTELFSICPNITPEFRITTFKRFVKRDSDLNKSCRFVHDFYT
jgi:hypothetical protein